ncbi:S8 family peptidase [Halorussus gelatinilyticus]|uniref:S8 family peptidase n=1 Tax=Halorussus gelatinilyticus TaxID=2937524 RepID=A0A8U0IHN6_9EURY|nr:S8 family peptidase [Halorussus gelatinilyticus]UPW00215.1 S8 family peptidase [Halorussus gelatinilyticus]
MLGDDSGVSRRNVLKTAGGSLAAMSATGLAAAKPDDTVEVNVGFKSEKGKQMALAEANDVVRKFDSLDVVTIQVPKKAATALDQSPNIRYVEENGQMQALAQSLPWGVNRVDADRAASDGSGADVAIIDTGIDGNHPDLEANLGAGAYAVQCSSYSAECTYGWGDDNGHGTHCAGITGAVDNNQGVVGVAPGVTLHAVKVLNSNGGGSYSDIAAGIEYVADQGWDVGSLSLGGSASSTVRDAVQYADSRGVTLVAAAGNSGPCSDCVGYPAAYPETIAVSSTNSNDDLSSFSSTGPEVDIAAPGSDIYSTYVGGGYDTLSGTSMATPHVAGAAGILRSQGLSNAQTKNRLLSTAENIGLASNESGAGLLDVEAATQ